MKITGCQIIILNNINKTQINKSVDEGYKFWKFTHKSNRMIQGITAIINFLRAADLARVPLCAVS